MAARGNFATVDANGVITDRRAGRISTDECIRLCAKLQAATGKLFPDYEVVVEPVKEHRFVFLRAAKAWAVISPKPTRW